MNSTTISHDLDDGVLTVTLDRPEALNSFTPAMADELEQTFREVNDDDSVRAIIVTGAGKAFCAGMDLTAEGNVFGLEESQDPGLAEMDDLEDPALHGIRDTGGRVTLAIHDCRKPVIAAINGAAVGIGATMTLAMDARLVSTKARVGFVFGRLGIVPEAASSWFLPRIVGLPTALDLILSAEILDPDAAVAAGVATGPHESDDLLDAARELADRWTKGRSPVAVALARQMLRRNAAEDHPIEAHRIDSLAMFHTSIGDGKEGVAAFLDKRDPQFTGRASQMPAFYDEWIARGES
ncbi:crotonase/enoyl-CoA hydratase family protein [Janibacter cremeus]|uniref:Enoyl-CoA hydratase/carnithine racemase n=1 Tax=Janibacter cremeus TaxID=1285192 RepID=A0A852VU51_9MICO|nr:crotonase/enoyl-CoA hydratase family protein [Janibacter cremeus]NYF98203.1 enoyl-CoA hydratase/carnithine racemase [Janibacter cremeus]